MKLKNVLKTAFFAGTLVIGGAAAINFAPNAEAADYSNLTYSTKGETDFGVYKGKVIDIKNFYRDYASRAAFTSKTINGTTHYANKGFDNYSVLGETIYLYGDDPITAFVDKEYLKTPGDYVLYGDEYGYYVHTVDIEKTGTWYMSTILLLDFSFNKGEINGQWLDTQCYYNVEVVSQTAVITMNYDTVNNYYWKSGYKYCPNVPNESGSDTAVMRYCLGKSCRPSDGYLVAPVMNSNWDKPRELAYPAAYESLYAANLKLSGSFTPLTIEDANGDLKKQAETSPFDKLNLSCKVGKIYVESVTNESSISTIFNDTVNEMKEVAEELPQEFAKFIAEETVDYAVDKVLDCFPGWGDLIGFGIDFKKWEYGLYSRVIDKAYESGMSFSKDVYEKENNQCDFAKFGKGFGYHFNDFKASDGYSNKDLTQYVLSRHHIEEENNYSDYKEYIRYVMNYHDAISECKVDLAFSFMPMYKNWTKEWWGAKYYNYTYPQNVVNVSKSTNSSNVATAVNRIINVKETTNNETIRFDCKGSNLFVSLGDNVDLLSNHTTVFDRVHTNSDGTYTFKLNTDNVATSIMIWDTNTNKLVYKTNSFSTTHKFDLSLIGGHKYRYAITTYDECYDTSSLDDEIFEYTKYIAFVQVRIDWLKNYINSVPNCYNERQELAQREAEKAKYEARREELIQEKRAISSKVFVSATTSITKKVTC